MEHVRKIAKLFQNVTKLVREGMSNMLLLYFYLAFLKLPISVTPEVKAK